MILLIMGLPGAGKGTQADLIVEKYNLAHLSTGNLFRDTIASDSPLSAELKAILDAGNLVPDELTIKMLKAETQKEKYANGYLLDGFPRTVDQAKFLQQMLTEEGKKIDGIISIELSEDTILSRLTGRLTCPNCQATYHEVILPPIVEGICDKCQTKLEVRKDDTVESIKNRLEVAKNQTLPVIDYFKETNELIYAVDANDKDPQTIFSEITAMIGN